MGSPALAAATAGASILAQSSRAVFPSALSIGRRSVHGALFQVRQANAIHLELLDDRWARHCKAVHASSLGVGEPFYRWPSSGNPSGAFILRAISRAMMVASSPTPMSRDDFRFRRKWMPAKYNPGMTV